MSGELGRVQQNLREAECAAAKQQHALLSGLLFPRFSQAALAEAMLWSRLYYEADLSPEALAEFEKARPAQAAWRTVGWQNPLLVALYSSAILLSSHKARTGPLFKACAAGAPWLFYLFWKPGNLPRAMEFAEYGSARAESARLRDAVRAQVPYFERVEFRRLFPGETVARALAAHHRACLAPGGATG